MRRATISQRALIDINLFRDFRYIPRDSICADALDMLPDGNEIYIISKTNEVRLFYILRTKNISYEQSEYIAESL